MRSADAITALSALAQESRLAVFRLLVQRGPDGLTPGVIAETLDIPASTLSFHLKELNHASLISAQHEGRSLVYSANFGTMKDLVEFLYHNCCQVGVKGCGPECVPKVKFAAIKPKVKLVRKNKR